MILVEWGGVAGLKKGSGNQGTRPWVDEEDWYPRIMYIWYMFARERASLPIPHPNFVINDNDRTV